MPWDLDDLEEDAEFAPVEQEELGRLEALTPKSKAALPPMEIPALELESALDCWEDASPRQSAIVFLDIDVLRTAEPPKDNEYEEEFELGGPQLEQLDRIVAASGARLVISSAERLDIGYAEGVAAAFEDAGMRRPIGTTPDMQGAGRAAEINAWLAVHTDLVDLLRWIVIDTSPLTPDLHEHLVKIDGLRTIKGQYGLTQERADVAIKKLSILKN
mmetsp:Transcript_8844/g.24977  ORF Transcript_8844/g.24977 Transcript_8844/m.24977 type:complete len:216 (-) Transcript_8844:49-696(-)